MVAEEVMCGEMVTMHRGLREEVVQQACDTYFAQGVAPNIFPEMRELVQRLRESGCDVWAVSSSNQWIIRSGMRSSSASREIAFWPPKWQSKTASSPTAWSECRAGRARWRRSLCVDCLISDGAERLDCAFGNAIWDREMLALSKHPFAINPNPNLQEIAVANGWTVYQPDALPLRKARLDFNV